MKLDYLNKKKLKEKKILEITPKFFLNPDSFSFSGDINGGRNKCPHNWSFLLDTGNQIRFFLEFILS